MLIHSISCSIQAIASADEALRYHYRTTITDIRGWTVGSSNAAPRVQASGGGGKPKRKGGLIAPSPVTPSTWKAPKPSSPSREGVKSEGRRPSGKGNGQREKGPFLTGFGLATSLPGR